MLARADVEDVDQEIVRLETASIMPGESGAAAVITAVAADPAALNGAKEAARLTGVALNGDSGDAGPVADLDGLRETAAQALEALVGADGTGGSSGAFKIAQDSERNAGEALKQAKAQKATAVAACEAALYDTWAQDLVQAEQNRKKAIEDVEDFLADQVVPARGAQGARCEKALSNGTFRPARDAETCAEDLCCAAARIPTGNGWRTVETCQPEAGEDLTMSWVALPRVALVNELPAPGSYSYTCIQGAQKLAAAATAAAAAVYMLA